ncbi:MAG: BatA domain-containing protein [Pirellulales bacterium]
MSGLASLSGVTFAFGFAQAALLGWLGAASIPIALHLWNRHRRKDVDWAAMRFLLAAIQRRSRMRRIEHWLLLALRTLIICAVALAAARPYAESRRPLGAANPSTASSSSTPRCRWPKPQPAKRSSPAPSNRPAS